MSDDAKVLSAVIAVVLIVVSAVVSLALWSPTPTETYRVEMIEIEGTRCVIGIPRGGIDCDWGER